MSTTSGFSLVEILAVAKVHPFYTSNFIYPPSVETVAAIKAEVAKNSSSAALETQALLWKKDLYTSIERLIDDANPENTFRRGIYTSITGGGSNSKPLFFATDVRENRNHRAAFGRFIRTVGLATEDDCAVTIHTSGELYRSLDLTLENLENAGATVLAAGHNMSHAAVVQVLLQYHANTISGESSQIIALVHYISTLPQEEQAKLGINKIIYTSESLGPGQRAHIRSVLGHNVVIGSFLGSAEAGPYAVSCPHLLDRDEDAADVGTYEDFFFDDRITTIEILPASVTEEDEDQTPKPIPDGEKGVIAQTSMARLRHPLVRYITGDIGSLHDLPEKARAVIPESEWKHIRILRLQGRDRRFSFEFDGDYIEFRNLNTLMSEAQYGVLQWQVILDKLPSSGVSSLEIRILVSNAEGAEERKSRLDKNLDDFFHGSLLTDENRFRTVFLKDMGGFELSATGRKVIKFIDRYT